MNDHDSIKSNSEITSKVSFSKDHIPMPVAPNAFVCTSNLIISRFFKMLNVYQTRCRNNANVVLPCEQPPIQGWSLDSPRWALVDTEALQVPSTYEIYPTNAPNREKIHNNITITSIASARNQQLSSLSFQHSFSMQVWVEWLLYNSNGAPELGVNN